MNKLALTLVIAYYIDYKGAVGEVPLPFAELVGLFLSHFDT